MPRFPGSADASEPAGYPGLIIKGGTGAEDPPNKDEGFPQETSPDVVLEDKYLRRIDYSKRPESATEARPADLNTGDRSFPVLTSEIINISSDHGCKNEE
jgi:hypothetical protein